MGINLPEYKVNGHGFVEDFFNEFIKEVKKNLAGYHKDGDISSPSDVEMWDLGKCYREDFLSNYLDERRVEADLCFESGFDIYPKITNLAHDLAKIFILITSQALELRLREEKKRLEKITEPSNEQTAIDVWTPEGRKITIRPGDRIVVKDYTTVVYYRATVFRVHEYYVSGEGWHKEVFVVYDNGQFSTGKLTKDSLLKIIDVCKTREISTTPYKSLDQAVG